MITPIKHSDAGERKTSRIVHRRLAGTHANGNGAACKRATVAHSGNNKCARRSESSSRSEHNSNLRNVLRPQAPRTRDFRFADTAEGELKTPLERVLSRLDNVQPCGGGHSARCPAHADSRSSLAINEEGSGKVLLYCHAGCSFAKVVQALGLEPSDLFPASSKTEDPEGESVAKEVPSQTAANASASTDGLPRQFAACEAKPMTAEGSQQDWAVSAQRHQDEADDRVVEMLGGELGVSAAALRLLQIGWNEKQKCYTFPERNGKGEVVGISCRFEDGSKKAIRGSKRGLIFASCWAQGEGPLLIPEGASDTAAALTMDLAVVGRPSANGGLNDLVELLDGFPDERDIVVVGEMDAKADGTWPGRDAAQEMANKLAAKLKRPVKWCLPPGKAKDIRDWLRQQGTPPDPADTGKKFLQCVKCHEVAAADRFRIEFINTRTLEKTDFRLEWLINDVLVAGQLCVVGGPKKTLKTSVLIDLAVSLGSGYRFLNHFEVPKAVRVGLISGESGEATIKETYLRIRQAKQVLPPGEEPAVDVRWAFRLPQLGTALGLTALQKAIVEQGLKVVILDPIYTALLAGSKDAQASNIFQMGPLLADITGTCLDAGATPVLVHHNTKAKSFNFEVPELEDLAYAGFQESARQWMLLGRRKRYEPGTGEHKLWLNVGGSAGFSGCWALDINEGVVDMDFCSRRWDVQVKSMTVQLQADRVEKQQAKLQKDREGRNEDMDRIRQVLRENPEGETVNQIAPLARLGKQKAERLIAEMVRAGEVEETEVVKSSGRGQRPQPGYKLADVVKDGDEDVEKAAGDDEDEADY